jgi:plastocyanin
MRSLHAGPTAVAVLAALALAACAGSSPGWTYAPAPSVTAAPSTAASVQPSGAPASAGASGAAPSGAASGSGGPAASGQGPTLEVTAQNIAFEEKELTAPADQPFTIHFVNADAPGTPHDVDIRDANGQVLEDEQTTDGGAEANYEMKPLPAGEYTFFCSVHPIPNMTGKLTVQ